MNLVQLAILVLCTIWLSDNSYPLYNNCKLSSYISLICKYSLGKSSLLSLKNIFQSLIYIYLFFISTKYHKSIWFIFLCKNRGSRAFAANVYYRRTKDNINSTVRYLEKGDHSLHSPGEQAFLSILVFDLKYFLYIYFFKNVYTPK